MRSETSVGNTSPTRTNLKDVFKSIEAKLRRRDRAEPTSRSGQTHASGDYLSPPSAAARKSHESSRASSPSGYSQSSWRGSPLPWESVKDVRTSSSSSSHTAFSSDFTECTCVRYPNSIDATSNYRSVVSANNSNSIFSNSITCNGGTGHSGSVINWVSGYSGHTISGRSSAGANVM